MPPTADGAITCPRCNYDLRGAVEPRCPECGFAFTWPEFETGVVRDNQPTWLDACDPWQPHQVLFRGLYELVRGCFHPRRVLKTVDVNGPLAPALLMFATGMFWTWLLLTALVALAILLHDVASPAAAIKTAALVFAPRMLLVAAIVAIGLMPYAAESRAASLARLRCRPLLRLTGYFAPILALCGCVLFGVTLLLVPDAATHGREVWAVAPHLIGLVTIGWPARRPTSQPATIALSMSVLVMLNAWFLAIWLLPQTLEPPWWIYF